MIINKVRNIKGTISVTYYFEVSAISVVILKLLNRNFLFRGLNNEQKLIFEDGLYYEILIVLINIF